MKHVVGALLGAAMMWQVSVASAQGTGESKATSERRSAAAEDATPRAVEEPEPPRRMRDRNAGPRLGLIIGGSVALTLFYGLPCSGEGGLWCVPFAGPVLVVAKSERRTAGQDDGGDGIVPPAFVYALAGSLGMLQLAGAVMVTAGALLPRREVPEKTSAITILPMVSSSTAGVAATGTW